MQSGFGWQWRALVMALVIGIGAAAHAAGGFPEPKRDFSADVAMTLDGGPMGKMESKGRVYFGGGHQRREVSSMGRQTTVIQRADGTVWTLMHAQKIYMESKDGGWSRNSGPNPMGSADAKLEKIGHETLDGLETDMYKVTAKDSTGTAWLTSDNVPVRYVGKARDGDRTMTVRMDYTNHQFGKQEAELFELPEGFSRASSFGGRGMPGQGMGGAVPDEAELRRQAEQIRKQAELWKQQHAPAP